MSLPHETLITVLASRAGFEMITNQASATQVKLFGRVQNPNVQRWLATVSSLLIASRTAEGWSVDVSRQYFLRGDKLFFGWRLILQGSDIQSSVPQVSLVVQETPVPQAAVSETQEIKLNVAPNRNAMRNGRGVQPVGGVPLAVASASARMGNS